MTVVCDNDQDHKSKDMFGLEDYGQRFMATTKPSICLYRELCPNIDL
jgi:hypothetical protein